MIVYGAASAGVAALIQPILDRVLPRHEELGEIITAILALYLIKGAGAYLSGYWMTDVGQRVVRDLRNLLFTHILGQSAAFFSTQTSGRLMSRITNDVAQIQQAVSETLGDLARETLALVGFAALLFYYDARLALVCLTGAPLVVYPLVRLGQRVRRTTRHSQEALAQITHVSAEAFTGHRIVKAFGAEQRETDKFRAASEGLYRASMKVTSTLSILPPLMEFIGGVAFAVALWYGSQEISAARLTTGEFVGFIAALFQNRVALLGALAGLLGGAGAAIIGALARYFGGGAGVAPVLPLAWIDLAVALPCPLVAALIAGVSARLAASRIVGEMP